MLTFPAPDPELRIDDNDGNARESRIAAGSPPGARTHGLRVAHHEHCPGSCPKTWRRARLTRRKKLRRQAVHLLARMPQRHDDPAFANRTGFQNLDPPMPSLAPKDAT